MKKTNQIVLSVITITYNNLSGLKTTIDSIDYNLSIEHIVVDGASSDNTPNFLASFDNSNLIWTSEKDNGIYDAMNKGLEKAKGKYVIFMNAGDSFHQSTTLVKIVEYLSSETVDILYGETMFVDEQGTHLGIRSSITTRKLPQTLNWKSLKNGMLVCHQSFICRRAITPSYISNNLSADIDWEIRCLKNAQKIIQFPNIISSYLVGGVSVQQHNKSLKDRFTVMREHYGFFNTISAHVYFVIRAALFKLNLL